MDPSTLAAAAQPDELRATLAANADDIRTAGEHQHGGMTTVRRAEHAGHEIVIETTYSITVDGQPFDAGLSVGNGGKVHYHGLPTQAFDSAVDLVKRAIDVFPDDFRPGPGHEPDHDDHDQHDHDQRDDDQGHEGHEHGEGR